ncbi:hypothetical protein AB7M49_003126 [Bradyrhizobium elkanii]
MVAESSTRPRADVDDYAARTVFVKLVASRLRRSFSFERATQSTRQARTNIN